MSFYSSSGINTPNSDIHPTAARRGDYITVQSENTTYTDETITAKYVNRGAKVEQRNGQFTVIPTTESYEFQTQRQVGKTG